MDESFLYVRIRPDIKFHDQLMLCPIRVEMSYFRTDGTLRELMAPHILRVSSDDDQVEVKYLSVPSGRHYVRLDNIPVSGPTNYQVSPSPWIQSHSRIFGHHL